LAIGQPKTERLSPQRTRRNTEENLKPRRGGLTIFWTELASDAFTWATGEGLPVSTWDWERGPEDATVPFCRGSSFAGPVSADLASELASCSSLSLPRIWFSCSRNSCRASGEQLAARSCSLSRNACRCFAWPASVLRAARFGVPAGADLFHGHDEARRPRFGLRLSLVLLGRCGRRGLAASAEKRYSVRE
jgi:hypothetical protein